MMLADPTCPRTIGGVPQEFLETAFFHQQRYLYEQKFAQQHIILEKEAVKRRIEFNKYQLSRIQTDAAGKLKPQEREKQIFYRRMQDDLIRGNRRLNSDVKEAGFQTWKLHTEICELAAEELELIQNIRDELQKPTRPKPQNAEEKAMQAWYLGSVQTH